MKTGCSYEILQSLYRIITFLWVPALVGVQGNETVDQLAKSGLKANQAELATARSEAETKSFIWNKIVAQWQKVMG